MLDIVATFVNKIMFNEFQNLDETKSLPHKSSPSPVEPQPPPIEHQPLQVEPQLLPGVDNDPSTVGKEGVYGYCKSVLLACCW